MRGLFVCLALLAIALGAFAQEPGQAQIAGTGWARFTRYIKDENPTDNSFQLARGYFTYYYKFSNSVSTRFTVDMFSDATASHGAGLKLKYGYLDFVMPVKDLKLEAGIIKNYFGTIYDWDYVTIEKALDDKESVVGSSDIGLALAGFLPAGWGEYQVGMYNGEGYNKPGTKTDLYPLFTANARVIPIPGVTLGGSVRYGMEEDTLIGAMLADSTIDTTLKDMPRMEVSGVLRLSYKFVDIWGQYINKSWQDLYPSDSTAKFNASGFMIMPTLTMPVEALDDLQLVFRYDFWDPKTGEDFENNSYSRLTAGFNYFLTRDSGGKPTTRVTLNWTQKSYENKDLADGDTGFKKPETDISLQLRWDFKSNPF